ncbi:hypothetical protein LV779_04695 [Streptomyces thinghirensis]|nr:hypothetical protein [Streptomyces thinghirensis]
MPFGERHDQVERSVSPSTTRRTDAFWSAAVVVRAEPLPERALEPVPDREPRQWPPAKTPISSSSSHAIERLEGKAGVQVSK